MRITQILYAQHVGRLIKKQWFHRGKIKVIDTPAEELLKSHGFEVIDVMKFLNPPRKREKINVVGAYVKDIPKDQKHPDYKVEPCYIYKTNNVLIDGLEQAKVLTNTVEISQGLPDLVTNSESSLSLPDEVHSETQNKIRLSCMFEATQQKLPKKKDPLRPMFNFKREYGIVESRRNELLCKNLTTVCETFTKNTKNKSVILDAFFSTPFEKAHNKIVKFEVTSELLVTCANKLKPLAEPSSTYDIALPELGAMNCTISLQPSHFYEMQDIYYPGGKSKWPFVQTALVHFNYLKVKNAIHEPVTEYQFQGRALLFGFTIAAAQARARFNKDVKEMPEPIVVPVVQLDGKFFHFTIFQLNTLDIDSNSKVKNIFWQSEKIPLYDNCSYVKGRPVLEGYNPDVIKKLINFYNMK